MSHFMVVTTMTTAVLITFLLAHVQYHHHLHEMKRSFDVVAITTVSTITTATTINCSHLSVDVAVAARVIHQTWS